MADQKSDAQKEREARLNEALRANLRKRKQQTKARKAPAEKPEDGPDSAQNKT